MGCDRAFPHCWRIHSTVLPGKMLPGKMLPGKS
jgi:hypothetical protein